jgi:hypothetical protein
LFKSSRSSFEAKGLLETARRIEPRDSDAPQVWVRSVESPLFVVVVLARCKRGTSVSSVIAVTVNLIANAVT